MSKNQTIVFKTDKLEFVGVFNSWTEASNVIFKEDKSNLISKCVSGKIHSIDGHIFLNFSGYVAAKTVEEYRKKANKRLMCTNLYNLTPATIDSLSEKDAKAINDIIDQYMPKYGQPEESPPTNVKEEAVSDTTEKGKD